MSKRSNPRSKCLTTASGRKIDYESPVVASGLQTNWSSIPGLEKALADPKSGVFSIHSYKTAEKVWRDIDALRSGKAIFTQPDGVIKCAGGELLYLAFHVRKDVLNRGSQLPRKSCGWLPCCPFFRFVIFGTVSVGIDVGTAALAVDGISGDAWFKTKLYKYVALNRAYVFCRGQTQVRLRGRNW